MEFRKEPVITTARLTLQAIDDADRDALVALLIHPQVGRTYMVPQFASRADTDALFQRLKVISDDTSRFFYGIYWEDRLVGVIHTVDSTDTEAELGYAIHPSYSGKGIATEALGAAIEALFRAGYETVTAGAFQNNAASIRCMEKCGMEKLEKEEIIPYRGTDHLCVYYGKQK